jgi:5-formyltetrahydrofolate cyclo-ligase
MDKAELRKAMTAYLNGLALVEITARSLKVARHLVRLPAWKEADVVLAFLSMPHEIDTAPIIAAARARSVPVAVPLIEAGDIRFVILPPGAGDLPRDRWGIPVPDAGWPVLDPAAVQRPFVATPGLAFDRQGNRLGRGRGYYDRFLRRAREAAERLVAIGICFSGQVVDELPHGPNDQLVEGVVTETGPVVAAP